MAKTQAEIETFLSALLKNNEEFRWIGEPARNGWRINLNPILNLTAIILYLPYIVVVFIILPVLIFFAPLWLFLITRLWLDSPLISKPDSELFMITTITLIVGTCLSKLFTRFVHLKLKFKIPKINLRFAKIMIPMFGGYNYYAITNQRVIIAERGNIHDYPLMLMEDAVVGKPYRGASTLYIYDKTNPTGHLPDPIFQLEDITEEEAQNAYEILRQAREEALENRAHEMGVG